MTTLGLPCEYFLFLALLLPLLLPVPLAYDDRIRLLSRYQYLLMT
jgi:hypothetical protein